MQLVYAHCCLEDQSELSHMALL